MRKTLYLLSAFSAILLAGCFDTTQEITLNKDGSGVIINTTDLSNAIGMIKNFGGDDTEKMEKMNKDTTINFSDILDSLNSLPASEKELVKAGSLHINTNMDKEKFIVELKMPFSKTEDIAKVNAIAGKILKNAMKKQMGGDNGGTDATQGDEANEDTKGPAIDEYFETEYKNGRITRTLNKEKYATAADDEGLKALKEMSGMGSPMTMHYIFHLPKEVKKAEGKGVKVSDDKKTVTLDATIDDFFDDPSKMEFSIEY
ncbi:MAG: hypothetical protein JSU05_14630 [Bacteroidetes bacterium]|nr:hypothetical protein [Bacteroidota bacterium]